MTHNVMVTFSVGDTTPEITISISARQVELVTLNTIVSVHVWGSWFQDGYQHPISASQGKHFGSGEYYRN